ncbi:MAG: chromosomal replication initiator protein DnaA [Thermoplasmatota archaeon]
MGFLDWLIRGRGGPKRGADKKGPKEVPPSKEDKEEILLVMKELQDEKVRNIEQEKKLKEMERRFSEIQEHWVQLLERQQMTIEQMIREKGKKKTEKKPTPPATPPPVPVEKAKESGNGKRARDTFSTSVLPDKKFDNFVVDDANRFPYLAAEAVATGVGKRYNPLFIYGPVGVGKTHLLHAISNRMLEVDPRKILVYSSTEKFTDELLKALENDDLDGFRSKYREIDVLLIDDIQMLSGRETTQKEFFHMFNHLYNSGKQIVLCSDRPPSEIKELESRLRSRFEGGLIIDISVPTFEGRRQILVNLSQIEGHSLSAEVLDYLAFYLDSSVRELEGGYNRVTAYASLMKEPVTVSLVRKVLEGVLLKKEATQAGHDEEKGISGMRVPDLSMVETNPYSDLDLEEETDRLEKELLMELKRNSGSNE